MSIELNHLAAILHVCAGVWILWSKKKIVIIFQKENTYTLFVIFIVKSLQKEQNSTNLLLWPPICRNKSAITPKWFNSLDTNSTYVSKISVLLPQIICPDTLTTVPLDRPVGRRNVAIVQRRARAGVDPSRQQRPPLTQSPLRRKEQSRSYGAPAAEA